MDKKNILTRKNAGLFLLLFLLLITAFRTVRASEDRMTGSLELHLPANLSQGTELTIYPVADIDENGELNFREPWSGFPLSMEELLKSESASIRRAAEQLYVQADESDPNARAAAVVDENGIATFPNLPSALYLVAQTGGESIIVQKTLILIPYRGIDGGEDYNPALLLKYDIPTEVVKGTVTMNKVDDEKIPVSGALFVLQKKEYILSTEGLPDDMETGQDSGGTYAWIEVVGDLVTDENGKIEVKDLPEGIYRFVEIRQPDGYYITRDPGYFSIAKETPDSELVITDAQTRILIRKVDDKGNGLASAKLVIKDAAGNVLMNPDGTPQYMFYSETEGIEITKLPIGSYLLSELEVPEGYEYAADVPFEITPDSEGVIEVRMEDPVRVEIPESGTLLVRKTLQDLEGRPLTATKATFYVALFSDEFCESESRVSEVKKIEFEIATSSTVLFENLDPGAVYYLCETNEYGDKLDEELIGEAFFVPAYPNGQTISFTPDKAKVIGELINVFTKIPEDFFYAGEVTIVKEMQYGPMDNPNMTEPFYVTIFDHNDNIVETVALNPNGGRGDSANVHLYIGRTPDASRTYTIRETDADGNPLDESKEPFSITISSAMGDAGTIVLRPDAQDGTVTVTNTWPGYEPTPTPGPTGTPAVTTTTTPSPTVTITPTVTPGGSYGGGGGGGYSGGGSGASSTTGGSSTTSNVKTGDTTPIAALAGILAAAVVVIGAVFVIRKKKNG